MTHPTPSPMAVKAADAINPHVQLPPIPIGNCSNEQWQDYQDATSERKRMVEQDAADIDRAFAPTLDWNRRAREAMQALPDFDIENPDAADFKDHASDFMRAMRLARTLLSEDQST